MTLTPAERQTRYRERHKERIEKERDALPKLLCACGCGELIPILTAQGKPATYKHNHHPKPEHTLFKKGQEPWNKGKPYPIASKVHKGKKKSFEAIVKTKATRLKNNNGVWQVKKGWKHTPETIENMRKTQKLIARYGSDNHMFGKSHKPETIKIISQKLSGENNPNWKGGVGTLPYGPDFTKKFKRLIRKRDNNTCQRCGKTRIENKGTMQIHHIDHDKMNNDPVNLATVCNGCNVWLSYHKDEVFKRIKD